MKQIMHFLLRDLVTKNRNARALHSFYDLCFMNTRALSRAKNKFQGENKFLFGFIIFAYHVLKEHL